MSLAGLLPLIIVLVICGAVLYLVGLVPMDAVVKQVIRVIVIVVLILYFITWLWRLLPAGG